MNDHISLLDILNLPSEKLSADARSIRDYFIQLLRCMPNNVYWVDKNGVLLGCSEPVLKFVGVKKYEDIIGKNYEEITKIAGWTPEQGMSFKRDDQEVIRTGKAKLKVEEPIFYDTEGKPVYYLSSRIPLYDENHNIIGIAGISVDITELKEAQKKLEIAKETAESANKAKDIFLRNISHDLRTPFSGLVTLAESMAEDETDREKQENLQHISESAKVLLNYLNKIFEHVSLGNAAQQIVSAPINFQKILRDSMLTIEAAANSKGLHLHFDYPPELPATVLSDEWRLVRIFMNLLSNAVKFTEEGEIALTVYKVAETEKTISLGISVSDTGIGIPEDKREFVFEEFARLTPAYLGKYAGTGLGLYDVRKLCQELGGRVVVTSNGARGTVFTCFLTFNKTSQSENIPEEKLSLVVANNNMNKTTTSSRILVVEDHSVAAIAAKNVLTKLGCKVDIANDGKTALEMLSKNIYSLVFMDIGLPDIDGCEVARQFRLMKTQPSGNLSIIALTAHADEKTRLECRAVGMNAVLAKPLTREKAESVFAAFLPHHDFSLINQHDKTAEKIIDRKLIEQALGNELEMMEEILDLLENSLAEESEKLNAAYCEQNWPAALAITCKIRGSCDYVGALRLKAACTALEDALRAGRQDLLGDCCQDLLTEMVEVREAIKTREY